jgi:hypothetical protein
MNNEISQLDISGIQLRDSKTQPKVSHSREIGEAQIVHNIFGKAKVRIIRKHDAFWRSLWLAVAFVVAVTSTYVLQSWYAARQEESKQVAVPVSARADMRESAVSFNAENVVAPSVPPAVVIEPAKPAPAEIAKPVVIQKNLPQTQVAIKSPEKEVSKPAIAPAKPALIPPKSTAIAQPAAVQQTAEAKLSPSVMVGNAAAKPHAIPPTVAKSLPPRQPAASAVAATAAAKIVAPASSPAAAPAQGLSVKEDTSMTPAVGKQLSSPVESGN